MELIDLVIDPSSKEPPYEQLRSFVIEEISSRRLPGSAKLPTVRKLAEQLELAPNTVARTYRLLESEGYIETRGRGGTFVAEVAPPDDESRNRAEALTSSYVSEMRLMGFGPDAIKQAISRALT